jgi:hypothetical protein
MKPIIFNHIPRSGGTTLRIILNRVYGAEKVFFIRSTDIGGSLEEFNSVQMENDPPDYRVISGHGAELFTKFYQNPFRITILREPVSLFVSQYDYLKASPNSNFLEEVKALKSLDKYIDYALQNGQDNMLCRMLSGSQQWLLTKEYADMDSEGEFLLEAAKKKLHAYDAILDLSNFDAGVFALSKKLDWRKIPVYRKSNKSQKSSEVLSEETKTRLMHLLRFDITLYGYFQDNELDIAQIINTGSFKFKAFSTRQSVVNALAMMIRKS